ncbi:MAG: ABC transporter ATP-binding protein, partial [Anaerolineaceae bacterium]|nr:ABC transporter ATP-binding protein [Anaerolineaceae bacterium]
MTDKPKHEAELIFLFKQIWKYDKGMYLSMTLYTIFFSLTPMIAIYVPKLIIDSLQSQNWQRILIIIIGGFVLSASCAFMTEFLRGNYRMRFNAVRYKLIEQLNLTTMTMAYPLTEDADILDQLRNISQTLLNPHAGAGGIMEKFLSIFGSIVGVIGLVAVISTLNIWVLLALLVTIFATYYLSLRAGQYEQQNRDAYHSAYRRHYYTTETSTDFRFGKDIRMYQLGGLLKAKRDEAAENAMVIGKAIANKNFSSELAIAAIGLLRDLLIYGYITYSLLQGDISAGDFFLYSGAATTVVFWLSETMRDLGFIQVQRNYVRKYQDFIRETRIPADSGLPVTAHRVGFDIEFRDVSFKYPGSDKLVLVHLNLKIPYGERLALVGENG